MSSLWTNHEQESGFQLLVSSFSFRLLVSSFQLPVSSVWFLTSFFRLPASSFRLPVSSARDRRTRTTATFFRQKDCMNNWIMNTSWTAHEQFMNSSWTNPDWFSRPSFWQETTKLGCNMCNRIPSPCLPILSLLKLFSSSSVCFDFLCSRFLVHPAKNFHEQFMNSLWTVHERVHKQTKQHPSRATVRAPSALLCPIYPPRKHVIHAYARIWIYFPCVVVSMVRMDSSERGTW